MHSRDSQWARTFWIAGVGLMIGVIAVATIVGLSGISVSQLLSHADWSSSDTLANLYSIALVAILLAVSLSSTLRARQREIIRKLALMGDDSAMLTAATQPGLSSAQDSTGTPFSLRWKSGASITATAGGLRWQRPKKRDVFIAWNEARLLEVREVGLTSRPKKDEIFEYGYCLYADLNKFIEWTDAPQSQIAGERLSWEQKEQVQRELLAIVASRTNLPLRVIPDRHSTQQKMSFRSQISLIGMAFSFFLAAFPLGAGILALTAPLTTTFAINLCVAIFYGGIGFLLLGLMAQGLIEIAHPPTSRPAPPLVTSPGALPGAQPDLSVAIRFGERLHDRLIALVLLIVSLVIHVYLVIRAMRDFSIDDLKHDTLTDLHKLGLGLLMTCAFIGVAILFGTLFSHSIVLTADAEGVQWGKGNKRVLIPWPDVAVLSASFSRRNRLTSFQVVEAPPRGETISWPAKARWMRSPGDASSDDAGAQFAAIVAQRAGVEPTTRWA